MNTEINAELVLIAHYPLGSAFADLASHVLGQTANLKHFDIIADEDPNDSAQRIFHELKQVDSVLILTDLYGATPCNIASQVVRLCRDENIPACLIAGLNGCMLLRALTTLRDNLDLWSKSVLDGGHNSLREVEVHAINNIN